MNRKIIIAPSGALVEIKEVKKGITLVYQLDDNNNRIEQINSNGGTSHLIGIITTSKIQDQLNDINKHLKPNK
ncbi:MAG: hypothetical protein GY834_09925 [Bacteroidetes bacterium]|nr:hypothetical protein [Bacteroidota bacterium]